MLSVVIKKLTAHLCNVGYGSVSGAACQNDIKKKLENVHVITLTLLPNKKLVLIDSAPKSLRSVGFQVFTTHSKYIAFITFLIKDY